MTLETKYNIGDTVYLIEDGNLIKTKIVGVRAGCVQSQDSIMPLKDIYYRLTYQRDIEYREFRLYPDEQKALESIQRKDYLD